MIVVHKEIVPMLPKDERYDLVSQIKRSSKAAPALIAEGFAKRYQDKAWRKYITDTIGEANEMVHHLSVCIDIYSSHVDVIKCKALITDYDISCRQLTKLSQSWENYNSKNKLPISSIYFPFLISII